jgi:hypothetical protein
MPPRRRYGVFNDLAFAAYGAVTAPNLLLKRPAKPRHGAAMSP